MAKDPDITRLFDLLQQYSDQLPAIRSTDWFSDHVFTCRSEKTCDYLHEIRDNLHMLNNLSPDSESYSYLLERVDTQLNAFIQAIIQTPGLKSSRQQLSSATTGSGTEISSLQRLYQELAKHHGYEQQLADNLKMAQESEESFDKAERIKHCQQRLYRCRQALEQIEDAIRDIEES